MSISSHCDSSVGLLTYRISFIPADLKVHPMADSVSTWLPRWTTRAGLIAAVAIGLTAIWNLPVASAQKDKPAQGIEDHGRESANLKQAFGGMQVDLFFVMGELESQKPGLAGVKFIDAVDVTGKELLRFERAGESWLIDPDTVFAYHLHKAK